MLHTYSDFCMYIILYFYSENEDPISEQQIKAYNLEGSLFKWANEGRPMVNSEGVKTIHAHPYSVVWGRLLHRALRYWP